MKKTSARIGRVSSIGTSGNQTGQYQKNTADRIGLLISAFPSMFWLVGHESILSEPIDVNLGVPQGSVLDHYYFCYI